MGEIPHGVSDPQQAPISRPPRIWTVGLAVAALFCGLVVISLLVALATLDPSHLSGRAGTPPPAPLLTSLPGLLALAAAMTLWILTVAVFAAIASPEPFPLRLGLVRPFRGADVAVWVVAIVGALALSQAVDFGLRASGAGRGASLEHMIALLRQARGPTLALALLVVGAGAGVAEELFFRGYVQRRFVQRFGGTAGVIAAAALFALAHLDPQHSAFAFVFGLYLGALALWTGSTWTAVVVHGVNNAVAVLLAATGLDDSEILSHPPHLLLVFAGLTAFALVCLAWVRRRMAAARANAASRGLTG